jgi:hypothetical protein
MKKGAVTSRPDLVLYSIHFTKIARVSTRSSRSVSTSGFWVTWNRNGRVEESKKTPAWASRRDACVADRLRVELADHAVDAPDLAAEQVGVPRALLQVEVSLGQGVDLRVRHRVEPAKEVVVEEVRDAEVVVGQERVEAVGPLEDPQRRLRRNLALEIGDLRAGVHDVAVEGVRAAGERGDGEKGDAHGGEYGSQSAS